MDPFPPSTDSFPLFRGGQTYAATSSSVSGSLWATREAGAMASKSFVCYTRFFPVSACPSLHGGFQLKYWVQRKLCFDLHMWKDTTSDVGLCFFSIRDGQRAPYLLTFFD